MVKKIIGLLLVLVMASGCSTVVLIDKSDGFQFRSSWGAEAETRNKEDIIVTKGGEASAGLWTSVKGVADAIVRGIPFGKSEVAPININIDTVGLTKGEMDSTSD